MKKILRVIINSTILGFSTACQIELYIYRARIKEVYFQRLVDLHLERQKDIVLDLAELYRVQRSMTSWEKERGVIEGMIDATKNRAKKFDKFISYYQSKTDSARRNKKELSGIFVLL